MPELTIFEGADCSGKSTNAKKYVEEFGGLYIHCGAEAAEDPLMYFVEKLKPLFEGKDVVLDRSWLSDIIYGTHVRKWTKMTPSMMTFFEDAYSQFRPFTFLHVGDVCNQIKLWKSRKHEEYVQSLETFEQVIETYINIYPINYPCKPTHYPDNSIYYPGKFKKVNGFTTTLSKLKEMREDAWK